LVLFKIKMIVSFKLTIIFYIPVKYLLMTIHVAKTIVTTAMRPKTRFFVVKLMIIDINPSAYKLNASEYRKSTCLNSSHVSILYDVFCLKKKIQFLQYLIQ